MVAVAADRRTSPQSYTQQQLQQKKGNLVFREATESRFMKRDFVTQDARGNMSVSSFLFKDPFCY
jgi:hypothetical protein